MSLSKSLRITKSCSSYIFIKKIVNLYGLIMDIGSYCFCNYNGHL